MSLIKLLMWGQNPNYTKFWRVILMASKPFYKKDFFFFIFFHIFNWIVSSASSISTQNLKHRQDNRWATIETRSETTYEGVSDKIQLLVSEFKSLTEPVDRVKRLLHYAAMLAPFDESARVPENRVKGCATQVWLDARIDQNGKVRFRADSDSEITKGFCSCLIWMMDGADPEEVVEVRAEDLVELNVGVHGKAQSRVNTWQNVLISMRDRTEGLMLERQRELPLASASVSYIIKL
ncbi:Fe-S metabolism associated domain [Theobroma cacao]|uniref:SufE-like protein 2, chloroplastic n=2 Tax=Theobroma cacao TaxID=3641 RepID=A0AB32VK74_THECC|nr:PREDICTED: sufE-like protein 2, chloroplastic [Theobroma cacao]EOY00667.1 Sulfur E2 [Theobroma cacao]WRX14715.1 Fe-S metabolism associated domain [Theobroma cacao]